MIQKSSTSSLVHICITGNDPIQNHLLRSELLLRFGKKIKVNIFPNNDQCLQSIHSETDVVFFLGCPCLNDDYQEEIDFRKKVRLRNVLTDVFVPHNSLQKNEAIWFLYDLVPVNPFKYRFRLIWKRLMANLT